MSLIDSDLHAQERENLLSNFLCAVQGCQVRYGGKTELAIESDSYVNCLCKSLEECIIHGLSPSISGIGIAAIKQVKGIVSSSLKLHLTFPSAEEDVPVPWWYIREFLTKHEYERFLLLKNVLTDYGRGRAWIRSLLNEYSLERYMHILVSDEQLLSQWYESWALLRDQEKAAMLPNLAAGLDSILFAINIDNEELDNGHAATVKNKLGLATVVNNDDEKFDKLQKKKKIPHQLVSFDDDGVSHSKLPIISSPLYHSAPSTCLNSPSSLVSTGILRVDESFNREETMFRDTEFEDDSETSSVTDEVQQCESSQSGLIEAYQQLFHLEDEKITGAEHNSDTVLLNYSSSNGKLYNSEQQVLSSASCTISDAFFITNDVENFSKSTDTESMKSFQDKDDSGVTCYRIKDTYNAESTKQYCSTLTVEELQSAILVISNAKELAETSAEDANMQLAKQIEINSTLKAQYEQEQDQHGEAFDRLTAKIAALSRENELLRHQLKKYVTAVQMLRKEETNRAGYSNSLASLQLPPNLRDYHDEAMAYENKLIQVAEMHGELMEFNEHLQKLLRIRESQIRHFKEELVNLRGPFPNDDDDDDELADTVSNTSDTSTTVTPRVLVNIWIPTAFLTGASTNAHHVYQIYVRIKDEEWNVYRRFAQFYELHKKLKRKDPIVKTFDFPQKKTFGYKEVSVVEERRMRLQAYLRRVVNYLVNASAEFLSSPEKSSLSKLFPFLVYV